MLVNSFFVNYPRSIFIFVSFYVACIFTDFLFVFFSHFSMSSFVQRIIFIFIRNLFGGLDYLFIFTLYYYVFILRFEGKITYQHFKFYRKGLSRTFFFTHSSIM